MTRRELIETTLRAAGAASAAGSFALNAAPAPAKQAPTAPVSIAKCPTYQDDLNAIMGGMFDQLGINGLVRNKTVTIKLNLTGSPSLRFQGRPLGSTHYTHPRPIMAMIHLLDKAGAQRIRLVESAWGTGGPLEEYMLDSGWNVRQIKALSTKVEFENTNARGTGKKYARFKTPNGGNIYSGFDLNQAYMDTDIFMSMAKLKNHATCGITLTMKNCFGNLPASIYGDDAGLDEPNESPTKGRAEVCHFGKRQPSRCSPSENDPKSSRIAEHRMPRIVADIAAARPIDIAFIDGVETMTGGEGPWIRGKDVGYVKPGVLILGTNAATTDAVGAAVMGYEPQAERGAVPFTNCDNSLKLAEAHGIGTCDLKRIEVRGVSIASVRFPFPGATPNPVSGAGKA